MIEIYRLRLNYKNYKKGNLVYLDRESNLYYSDKLSVWKRTFIWKFTVGFVTTRGDIFEALNR